MVDRGMQNQENIGFVSKGRLPIAIGQGNDEVRVEAAPFMHSILIANTISNLTYKY